MLPKIKYRNLYRYFFCLFLFFLPFQTRKVFLTPYSFHNGNFTEYGSIFFYFSDLLLVLSLTSLCLFNRDMIKNRLDEIKSKSGSIRTKKIFILLSGFLVWTLLSTFHNQQYPSLSLFRFLKLLEMIFLTAFIYIIFYDKNFFITSLFIVPLSGFFQSLLAIYQFLYQKSAFTSPLLHKLTGETILSPALPGVAKIVTEGEKLIRSYGTFPHPNVFGGFLIFSILITTFLYKEHRYVYLSSKYLCFKNTRSQQYAISIFWTILFSSQLIAFLLSFSRSAWLSLLLGINLFILLSVKYTSVVSRETIRPKNILKNLNIQKELFLSILFILILATTHINLINSRLIQDTTAKSDSKEILAPHNNTFNDRIFFNNVSRETITENPIFGSGPGTSTFQIDRYLQNSNKDITLESWQYQPTHNIYLLCAAETGIIGFFLLFYSIYQITLSQIKTIVSRETIYEYKMFKLYSLSILSMFLIIGFFDHYFFTSQQGTMIFWLAIGLAII